MEKSLLTDKIRFAVLGCGGVSKAHFMGITATKEEELVVVCDAVPARAEEFGQLYKVRAYSDYDELLAQPDVDVICVCTPSGMHPEQAIRAAEAGKHVICEKPVAIRVEDAHRMNEAFRRNNVKLAAILPRHMSPAAQFVKGLIEQGKLGKLSHCSGYSLFYRDQSYYDTGAAPGNTTAAAR
ncbi:Gfo/Idh/MocA family protein [Paenibacillus hodogayensis]|uniref:Gfo/Idh/MocA family protein n=1 Tax=Paenibacillus hodogayensis TaxID=279208 RepID=A0ABV5W5G8_9BACL